MGLVNGRIRMRSVRQNRWNVACLEQAGESPATLNGGQLRNGRRINALIRRRSGRPVELTDPQDLWMRLAAMQAVLARVRELELAEIGLTIDQASILFAVKTSAEPVSLEDVARATHKAPRILSALVRRMEVDGLLKTDRDAERPYRFTLSLTIRGLKAHTRWLGATTVPHEAWRSLSRKERSSLSSIARKLRDKGLELLDQMD
jgi:DNA-binding MarR family transcriptional regulator